MRDWRASAWKRAQVAAIAGLGYPLINALGHTLRWRVEGLQHYDAIVASGRQPVMAFWHGRILPATFYFRRRGIVVITSENFDGEWIARIIERFGYGTARGSTTRGGRKAMVQLVRAMKAGKPAGFTLDGPRGPARVAQPGAVWLAGATGNPILPFHLEAAQRVDAPQLGSDADSETVDDRVAGCWRADRGNLRRDGRTARSNPPGAGGGVDRARAARVRSRSLDWFHREYFPPLQNRLRDQQRNRPHPHAATASCSGKEPMPFAPETEQQLADLR